MFPSVDRRWLMAGIILVLVLGAALPASAMDKLFRFWSPDETGADIKAVRAYTNAMEVVTEQHESWRNPWVVPEGGTNVDYILKSGVYCTRIIYNELQSPLPTNTSTGEQWSWDKAMKIGWSTSDGSSRLNDLRWAYNSGGSESITEVEELESQVPGGGYVIGPYEGIYYWYVTNESDSLDLLIMSLQFTWVQQPPWQLDMGYLDTAMDEGGIGLLIRTLGDAIMWEGAFGDLKDPCVKSLLGKLESASEDHLAGLAAYEAGDPAEAEQDWAAAGKHVDTFIKEIETSMKTGKIREELAALWVPIAQDMIYRLDLLPAVKPPYQVNAPTPPQGGTYVVPPGGSLMIPLVDAEGNAAQPGDAVVLQGVLVNNGQVVLDWVDKADIKPDMIPPTVTVIEPEGDPQWFLGDGTVALEITDEGGSGLAGLWLIEHPPTAEELFVIDPSMISFVPEADLEQVDGIYYWSHTYTSATQVAFFAEDNEGNRSDMDDVLIQIISVTPRSLWPPNHGYVPIEIVVGEGDPDVQWGFKLLEDPFNPGIFVPVISNEPDDGLGDGDCPNDFYFDQDGNLWLRAERAGPENTRIYSFVLWVEDIAGNYSEVLVEIPVTHDMGT